MRPWWAPDLRGCVALGLFLLTGGVIVMIALNPSLADNQGFMILAQAVVVSGLLAVVNYLFGASKGASDANARADKALDIVAEGKK